jgi:hypothetical protein
LTGNRNRYAVTRNVVPRYELLKRLPDQLFAIGFRLREDLRILDVVERLDHHPMFILFMRTATQRLECALANIDTPDGVRVRHTKNLYSVFAACRSGNCTGSSIPAMPWLTSISSNCDVAVNAPALASTFKCMRALPAKPASSARASAP